MSGAVFLSNEGVDRNIRTQGPERNSNTGDRRKVPRVPWWTLSKPGTDWRGRPRPQELSTRRWDRLDTDVMCMSGRGVCPEPRGWEGDLL